MKENLSGRQEDHGLRRKNKDSTLTRRAKKPSPGKFGVPDHSGMVPGTVSAIVSSASSLLTLKSSSFETFLSVSLTSEMT